MPPPIFLQWDGWLKAILSYHLCLSIWGKLDQEQFSSTRWHCYLRKTAGDRSYRQGRSWLGAVSRTRTTFCLYISQHCSQRLPQRSRSKASPKVQITASNPQEENCCEEPSSSTDPRAQRVRRHLVPTGLKEWLRRPWWTPGHAGESNGCAALLAASDKV